MSITDAIYLELLNGLEEGLDWQQFLSRHGASKGPLYNAIGRLFSEVKPKIDALKEEKSLVQSELNQAGLTLDSLNQQIEEAESNNSSLEKRESALNEQIETLEAELAEKGELAKHLSELGKLGFDSENLKQLQETLREIAVKHGLKAKEAVNKFFDDLKDYELVLGAEFRLKGLQTQIETKEIEAENWRSKEETLRRKHDDLKEVLGAVHALRSRGIKTSQIITWHRILRRFETAEQFDQGLAQYGDISGLLKARKEETENYALKLTKAQSRMETLEKERAKIEGAIYTLKAAGVKELKTMNKDAAEQLQAIADSEIKEIRAVGQEVRAELMDYLARFENSARKVFEIGQGFERVKQELQKYEGVKDALESHAAASEEEK
jgi:chromosome segregation ATPase